MNVPESVFTGKNRIHFSQLESTNVYALDLVSKTKPPEGSCIVADYQTGGIGQFGRKWHSRPGENLLVSFVFYPSFLTLHNQFMLNIVAALAVRQLAGDYVADISIKWPNDIYCDHRKLAGILIQNLIRGDRFTATVIGIGLNLNQMEFDPDLPNPVSLRSVTAMTFERDKILDQLSYYLENYWLMLKKGNHSGLMETYNEALYLKGIWSEFELENTGLVRAKIIGIDDEGKLQLQTTDGSVRICNMGEARYTLQV